MIEPFEMILSVPLLFELLLPVLFAYYAKVPWLRSILFRSQGITPQTILRFPSIADIPSKIMIGPGSKLIGIDQEATVKANKLLLVLKLVKTFTETMAEALHLAHSGIA